MTKWNVSTRIWLGFAAFVVMMALFSFQIYRHIAKQQVDITEITTQSWPGLFAIMQTDALVKSSHGLMNRSLIDSDSIQYRQDLAQIQANWAAIDQQLKEYAPTVGDGEDRRLLNTVYTARAQAESDFRVLFESSMSLSRDQQLKLYRERVDPAMVALTKASADAVAFDKKSGDDYNRRVNEDLAVQRNDVLLSLLVPLFVAVVIGFFLVRAVNRPLVEAVSAMKASGTQISTSAMELAATAQQQLATANEVAATTAEVGATSKQISATSIELRDTVKGVTEIAERTAVLAGNGQTGLSRMKTTMQQITDASASINERLAVLSEKAGTIGTVVTTITKVADQTNLLSLNAAIEAEKAGEHGRGFAVVATEIRRLADQTALATGDIEGIVKEMQSAVSAGVMGMDKFSEEVRRGGGVVQQVSDELSQIIQQVQTLTPSFEAVEEGMQSQTIGAQQISEALAQLGEASRQTVESLRQSNMAIEQLNVASRTLQDGVTRFSMVSA
jgi:methyl-accepting chemotaxis protein WspA